MGLARDLWGTPMAVANSDSDVTRQMRKIYRLFFAVTMENVDNKTLGLWRKCKYEATNQSHHQIEAMVLRGDALSVSIVPGESKKVKPTFLSDYSL